MCLMACLCDKHLAFADMLFSGRGGGGCLADVTQGLVPLARLAFGMLALSVSLGMICRRFSAHGIS